MKVALVIEKFRPAGGAERQCAYLAKELLQRGHEVHVYARQIAETSGIHPHKVPPEGIFMSQTFAAQVRKMLMPEKFDIIHSFTHTDYQDILRLGGGTHREYLLRTDPAYSFFERIFRGMHPKEKLGLTLERASLRPGASRKIVAISHRVKEEAIRHYNVPADEILVIRNGVDANDFKPSEEARRLIRNQIGIGESEYVLLFVGSGFRRKGLEYAIQAIDRVPSAKLVVVGEGRATPHPRVLMLGWRTDVPHLYAAADAFIFPTLYEPFGNVVLEAMASGIPAIVSRVAGVSEVIDNDSIVVEDPMNIDELSAAVKRLEDPAIRKPMGEAARRKAMARPLEQVFDENFRLYEQVVAMKRQFPAST